MRLLLAPCLLIVVAQVGEVRSASAPERTVRFIVLIPPGGSNDLAARTLAQALSGIWAASRVGGEPGWGGGNIRAQAAASSIPDGYTYLLSSTRPITINPSLSKAAVRSCERFRADRADSYGPIVLIVNSHLPSDLSNDLIALAKRRDGKLNFASSASGLRTISPPNSSRRWITLPD